MTPRRTLAKRVWHELTRPRGPVRHRFYRGGRRSKAGVALLMTISSVMLMSILVTEIAYSAIQRATVAAQYRDEVAAELLARSGLQFHHMILIASQTIGQSPAVAAISRASGSNSPELWQAIPFIDTRFLRMVIVDAPTSVDDVEGVADAGGLTDEQIEESRSEGSSLSRRSFLDFDGDFNSTVTDEERLINVRSLTGGGGRNPGTPTTLGELLQTPAAAQLNGLFMQEQHQEWLDRNNLVREELIANLADWTDPDDIRIFRGGSEDALYDRGDRETRYFSKNAPFDTREEIRLVEGWHRDGVWERVGRHLTVNGSGKVNVNTAPPAVLFGLVRALAEGAPSDVMIQDALAEFTARRSAPPPPMGDGIYVRDAQTFVDAFANLGIPLRAEDADNYITNQSKVFRIRSVGEVGDARAEAEMVVDFTGGGAGRIVYWNVR